MLCSVNSVNLPFVNFQQFGVESRTEPQVVEGVGKVVVAAAWANGDYYWDGWYREQRAIIKVRFEVDDIEANYMEIKNTLLTDDATIDGAFSETGEDGRQYYCWTP